MERQREILLMKELLSMKMETVTEFTYTMLIQVGTKPSLVWSKIKLQMLL